MKTLFESILDAEATMNNADNSVIGARYAMGFYNTKAKYNEKKNEVKSNEALTITCGYGSGTIPGVNIREDGKITLVPWEEYDVNHAKFNCTLYVTTKAIINGFKYSMIDFVGKKLRFESQGTGKRQITLDLLQKFFDKKPSSDINIYFDTCPDNDAMCHDSLNVNMVSVSYPYMLFANEITDPLGYKDIPAKKLVIDNGKYLFDEQKISYMKDLLRAEKAYNYGYETNGYMRTKKKELPSVRIKTFLKNNPNTKLYISMGATYDKLELDGENIKVTNMSRSKVDKD